MASAVLTAVNAAVAALKAVDWVAECSEPVEVDATPEREFKQKDIEEKCVVHLSYGGTERKVLTRNVTPLINKSQFFVSIVRYISPDEAGLLDLAATALVDRVIELAVETVAIAIRDTGTIALLSPIEQPEAYDPALMRLGVYAAEITFNVQMGGGT